MGLHAGRLRHVIEIQESIQIQNASTGGMVERWQTVSGCSAVPAEIVYISGREFISSNAKQSEIVARITIRNRTGITTKMRIIGMGKTFDIQGILPDHETGNTWLTMPVSEVLNLTIETPVIFSYELFGGVILTDYTCVMNSASDQVSTQLEFQYLAIKQDVTIRIPELDLGDTFIIGFSDGTPSNGIGVFFNSQGSYDVIGVGNSTNYTSLNHNLDSTAEYTIAVDGGAGTYGTAYLYENGVLLLSHELTQALGATPDRFAIFCQSTAVPATFTLVDVRSYDIPNSTAWNRY